MGWLDDIEKAQGGNSTEPGLPVYYGPSEFPCTGAGCSKIASLEAANLYGVTYEQMNPQDAWYKRAAILKNKGKEIWNVANKKPYSGLKVGDLVSLDRPTDPHGNDKSKVPGYTMADNEHMEHLGVIVGMTEDGEPLVKHGSEHTKTYVQPISKVGLPEIGYEYKPKSIYRASSVANKELKSKGYYGTPEEPIPLDWASKAPITENKQKYLKAINDNIKRQQVNLGLGAKDANLINKVSYGIFNNESEAGDTDTPIGGKMFLSKVAHAFGRDVSPSLGDVQFKYDDLAYNADGTITKVGKNLQALGVDRQGMAHLTKHRDDYNDEVNAVASSLAVTLNKLKTDPKYKYNPKTNTVYGNIPLEQALATTYKWGNSALKEERMRKHNTYGEAASKAMQEVGSKKPVKTSKTKAVTSMENGGQFDGLTNEGFNYNGAWGGPAQNGTTTPPESHKVRLGRVKDDVGKAIAVNHVLNYIPGGDTVYDFYNILDAYKEGDPMKILPNVAGAIIPGVSGQVFESFTNEYAPKTSAASKKKFIDVMKGKRATPEEMRKAQESVDWAGGWKKLKEDVIDILPRRMNQSGGTMPGSVGFSYARTGAPSNGKYAKKTLPSAQDGMRMSNAKMKRGVELQLKERENALKDYEELHKTGMLNNPRSVEYKQKAPKIAQVRKHVPQNVIAKGLDIAANPLTAAKYVVNNQDIPDRFTAGERNPLDNALDIVNPIAAANNIANIPIQIKKGEYANAALGALDVLPLTHAFSPALKGMARDLNDQLIYPIKYRKQIKEIENLHKNLPEVFNTPEGRERLISLGIDPDNLDFPKLTNIPREGSYYFSKDNSINMDARQAKNLINQGLFNTPKAVYEHEVGHWLQRETNRNSPSFRRELNKYNEDLALFNSSENQRKLRNLSENSNSATQEEIKNWIKNTKFYAPKKPIAASSPTVLDNYAKTIYNYDPGLNSIHTNKLVDANLITNSDEFNRRFNNADYFIHRGVEPLAHLREMRQNMIDKGYVKGVYDPISEETINKYVKENPLDRIASFTDEDSYQIEGLHEVFKHLPSVVGAGVVGAGAASTLPEQQKHGGVIDDDMGQWAHPGEVTRIKSSNITMQGVPYDVLGISDTGDTKLMKPGKNYKFKGNSVTEYPIKAKDGNQLTKLDQLTNFTNYNTPQPGGWLDNL